MTKQKYFIFAFYNFVQLEDLDTLKRSIMKLCIEKNIRGTILVAKEGINGTIAGYKEKIDPVAKELTKLFKLKKPNFKWSKSNYQPFRRLKVRLKNEIVTMGISMVDPNNEVGDYVEPDEWNSILSDPNVVVIDVRNSYEVEIGSFPNAINPSIRKFGEFPDWLERNICLAKKNKTNVVFGCTKYRAITRTQKLLRAATFGKVGHETSPGTLVSLDIFNQSGGFIEGIRAGDDQEWRLQLRDVSSKCIVPEEPSLDYSVLPNTFFGMQRKYFIYYAPVN